MAYKIGERIRPSRAGEFYANWNPNLPTVGQRDSDETSPDWNVVRTGRPRPAGSKSSAQMADEGWIGLYLKADRYVPADATEVQAPDWMSEPAAE